MVVPEDMIHELDYAGVLLIPEYEAVESVGPCGSDLSVSLTLLQTACVPDPVLFDYQLPASCETAVDVIVHHGIYPGHPVIYTGHLSLVQA